MTAGGYRVSLRDEEDVLKLIVVMVAQPVHTLKIIKSFPLNVCYLHKAFKNYLLKPLSRDQPHGKPK